jgi:hypothetical protein
MCEVVHNQRKKLLSEIFCTGSAGLPEKSLSVPRNPVRMSAFHVRRDKAALFQWVQGPPGDSLPPEATGAGMEVTKCLKPPDSGIKTCSRRAN